MGFNQGKSESIKVIVRCRPMESSELEAGHKECIYIDESSNCVEIQSPTNWSPCKVESFKFDRVYGPLASQGQIYENSFQSIVEDVLKGFNGTVLAYGQTGTGKTYTIQGVISDPDLRGLMPSSFHHIFDNIKHSSSTQYLVRASYLEIYNEEVRDLLKRDSNKKLEIKEKPNRGVYVKDLSTLLTKDVKEIERLLRIGSSNRSTGSTNMNEQSSRSHAIFILTVESCSTDTEGRSHIRVGKLNLVDLAGSERQSKTHSEGERLKEATKINLSLSTLGMVISALVDEKCTHVPYRDSKLTRLLQDSLGGNSKTVMVANIGPSSFNYEETLSTLRYACRAKNIKNKPVINEDPKDALLRAYRGEIERLKQLISSRNKVVHLSLKAAAGYDEGEDVEQGSSDDKEEDREENLKAQQEKLAAEKERIMNDQTMVAEEKTRLLDELKVKDKRIQQEKRATQALEARLRSLQSKLIGGGCGGGVSCEKGAVATRKESQAAVLEQRRHRLAVHRRREDRMRARVSAEADNVAALQQGFSSLQQEVDSYTATLKKLYTRFQKIKEEVKEVNNDHIAKRQKQNLIQEDLMRHMKLRQLILENFVPKDMQAKLKARAYYTEGERKWIFIPTDAASVWNELGDPASQLRSNNLLTLGLDRLPRTTMDYEPPMLAPQVAAALEAALRDEGDIIIDARIKQSSSQTKADRFPQSRGLIPK